ncbi:MAG: undecaprenyl/decaprenyl-phosphate alpha-N-acetylglucosaminyl 1-phosphate transferase [Lentisphaerae bacterium]|jgi:UDP-GlcNAc:undecaprenyl-phosphate GlcNAc-1-phosphate transferase|nr:undecaprenyl/decaprenyl-phosphate alpha-N-acetylglucosaminyl 1-phosphate transferase [Lentisphaerota bacterium]
MNWLLSYACAWITATLLAAVLTGFCRTLAPRLGLVDRPKNEAHKTHSKATPVAGGIGMCLAWLLTLGGGILVSINVANLLPEEFSFVVPGIRNIWKNLLLITACATLITLVGIVDDRKPMRAGKKFFLQFVIAAVTATWGPRLTLGISNQFICWIITVLWIMTVINALNFFDNMDGLAGGAAMIAAMYLLLIASIREQHFVAMLAAATGGTALGFLFHNRPPAKIFMGDGGSHFLGYCLAVICILTTFYLPGESQTFTPVLIPLLVLGIPLFDAVMVVLIRLKNRQPFYIGDNRHISHRFCKLGISRPYAVLLVCLLCFSSGAGAVTLLWLPPAGACVIFAQTGAMLAVISIIQFILPEGKQP